MFGIVTIVFFLTEAMPGNPVEIMLGPSPSLTQKQAIMARYGLDEPVHVRYYKYIINLLQGDMGRSLYYKVPVTQKILQRLPVTMLMVVASFIFATVTAIPLGILAAKRRNKPADHVSRVVALIGVSTPSFWIGLILIIVFAYQAQNYAWIPEFPATGLPLPWANPANVSGANNQWQVFVTSMKHLALPTISLGTLRMAAFTRIERSSMLEVLNQEYVKLARAYGVKESTIVRKHAFRNAQLPLITIMGLQLTASLGGAVLTETVFNIPGMGRLIITAVKNQDYYLVMGTTLMFGFVFIVGVIIVDLLYAYLDPRVSYEGGD
jgi:peptide/nickel transport system permease protein